MKDQATLHWEEAWTYKERKGKTTMWLEQWENEEEDRQQDESGTQVTRSFEDNAIDLGFMLKRGTKLWNGFM